MSDKNKWKSASFEEICTGLTHFGSVALSTLASAVEIVDPPCKVSEEDKARDIENLHGWYEELRQEYMNICKARNAFYNMMDTGLEDEARNRIRGRGRLKISTQFRKIKEAIQEGRSEEAIEALDGLISRWERDEEEIAREKKNEAQRDRRAKKADEEWKKRQEAKK